MKLVVLVKLSELNELNELVLPMICWCRDVICGIAVIRIPFLVRVREISCAATIWLPSELEKGLKRGW